jgi:NTP pyrophosphatase (non-canonical NTP hydrolase)
VILLNDLIDYIDFHLDDKVSQEYKDQPLAQDWARIGKVIEELGEAISKLIGYTGQNPRKGVYAEKEEMLKELADVAFTAIFAIQHFTKDTGTTSYILENKLEYIAARISKGGENSLH